MEKKYVIIFKCRGCGRDVIKNDVDLSAVEEWSLSEMFKDGYEYAEVSGGSRLSGQNKFLLHRCDPENIQSSRSRVFSSRSRSSGLICLPRIPWLRA